MNSLNLNNSVASVASGSDSTGDYPNNSGSAGNSAGAQSNPGSPDVVPATGTSADPAAAVNLPQSSFQSEPMEIDHSDKVEQSSSSSSFNPLATTDPVVTHVTSVPISTPARNTFDEDADQVLPRISECKKRIHDLYEQEAIVMRTSTSTIPEFQLHQHKINAIAQYLEYYRNALVSANTLFASFKDTSEKDHSDIPAKEIPVFDVKFLDLVTNPDIHATEDDSLQTFKRKFECTYLNYGVDVERHWFFHLEASFENNNSYNSWF
ncbi:uncharacterized protein EV154DRAFT_587147 [Mucor mucedo]|uniref:uncharacterized protein n=1 Tax=Mucor mucedo TaxID=29922 RepID=UPI00221FF3B7|nr:uncharacterized protein EV154DRAFT_587147 [Mucor mucedo]KAI7863246.1 hypothetical protein EV154DRAFT_587147 [Mucor mucedo]